MQKKSYIKIVQMITDACDTHFYNGTREIRGNIIECATKIYIEQMRLEVYGPCVDVSAQSPDEED